MSSANPDRVGSGSPEHRAEPHFGAYGIVKHYGPVHALRSVDIELFAGEIHALVGENGAGKSTLKRVLAGEERPDAGDIRLGGNMVRLTGPADARRLGIAVVHQHFPMVASLSVAENMYLGDVPRHGLRWPPLVDRRQMEGNAKAALDEFGLASLARRPMRDLSVAERQVVAIATALRRNSRILILDEPTSSLNASEVANLFAHMRHLRDDGAAVVFITHSMEEVLSIADRITVLRDGERIATVRGGEVDSRELVRMIVGRELAAGYPKTQTDLGQVLLTVDGMSVEGSPGWRADLHGGEILGLPAHMGSGIGGLLAGISGRKKIAGGRLSIDGRDITRGRERERIRSGVCLVPGDATSEGLIPKMSVAENILLANLGQFTQWGMVHRHRAAALIDELVHLLDIRPADPSAIVESLSGGNRQKVVIAKWLAAGARVLVMDDPTKGVDVGAKVEIYSVIGGVVSKGNAVLLASSDLDELIGLSDRIVVIRDGRTVAELERPHFDKAAILDRLIGESSGPSTVAAGVH